MITSISASSQVLIACTYLSGLKVALAQVPGKAPNWSINWQIPFQYQSHQYLSQDSVNPLAIFNPLYVFPELLGPVKANLILLFFPVRFLKLHVFSYKSFLDLMISEAVLALSFWTNLFF